MNISPNQNKTVNILLIGEDGNGKSTLGNQILGFKAFDKDKYYKCYKYTYGKKGLEENSDLFVIRVPRFFFPLMDNKYITIQFLEYISEIKELSAILLVFNYQQIRLTYSIIITLKILCKFFSIEKLGEHIGMVFTNSFTRKGFLTPEQKKLKLEKALLKMQKEIEEAIEYKISENIINGFVDIDSEEGINEDGTIDLDKILDWARTLPKIDTEIFKESEKCDRIEIKNFNEMKIEGDYIIKNMIKKEREIYYKLNGIISFGEWIEKEKHEEKMKITEDNLKIIKKQEEEKNEFLSEIRTIFFQNEIDKIKKEKKEKYFNIKNILKNAKEIKEGECDIIKNEFSEGIIKEDNEFIKEEKLDAEDSIFKTLSGYGQQEKILKKKFDGKIIVGWKLESKYKIGLGGKWERKKDILGTFSYEFYLKTNYNEGCDWKLSIWTIPDMP